MRTYASRLRKALGPDADYLVSESGGYAMRIPDDALDLTLAEGWSAAAEKARNSGDFSGARDLISDALALWALSLIHWRPASTWTSNSATMPKLSPS